MNKKAICFFILSTLCNSGFAKVPDFLSAKMGTPFPGTTPIETSNVLTAPSYYFMVPNSGETATIFPEYKVAILKNTNNVSVISASRIFKDMSACEKSLAVVKSWIPKYYPGLTFSAEEEKFDAPSSNIYIELKCYIKEHNPFPTLEIIIFGRKENLESLKAWENYHHEQWRNAKTWQ